MHFHGIRSELQRRFSSSSLQFCQALPSREDDAVTFSIRNALAPLEIVLLDHVIVSRFGFYSYRMHEHERGRGCLLTKLKEGE